MTGRALINSIKEGFRGIIRHPLVTIASITTIMLMLIIMGAFYMFSVNARRIMRKLSQRPPIEVYMVLQSTEEQRATVAQNLKDNPDIIEFTMASPEENYNSFKENLGSSSSILDDFDYNMYLPYTFNIRLSDPSKANEVCAVIETYTGVSKVAQESNVMTFLSYYGSIVRRPFRNRIVHHFEHGTYLCLLQSFRDRDHEICRRYKQLHQASLYYGRRYGWSFQRADFMGYHNDRLSFSLCKGYEHDRPDKLLRPGYDKISHVA